MQWQIVLDPLTKIVAEVKLPDTAWFSTKDDSLSPLFNVQLSTYGNGYVDGARDMLCGRPYHESIVYWPQDSVTRRAYVLGYGEGYATTYEEAFVSVPDRRTFGERWRVRNVQP